VGYHFRRLPLAIVRERGLDTPFIFVSGTIGEDTAVEAMRIGAKDYIMKGNRKRLLPAVERELREAQQRREQRRTEQDLRLLETATRAGADAADVLSALTATLSEICESTDWALAQAWLPRADGSVLECSPAWCCRDARAEVFRLASLEGVLASGEDLPGRVWASRRPWWLHDATAESWFRRAAAIEETGLRTALAIPVLAGETVTAVLEFFRRGVHEEDKRMVRLFTTVAEHLNAAIQRKRAEERLHYLAHYDDLTGLPNRVLFTDRLKQATVEADRHGRLVGVAFLDLDRFKTINDSLGHSVGDLLLKRVAERLGHCVREGDTVARLAGDEFTLVLADMAHMQDAAQVARKVLDSLAQPFHIAGYELFTSASLGMTLYPVDDESIEGLLRNADIAMYRAKDHGGNSHHFYSADMTSKARERLALENDLRRALERGEFLLHYQPIVSLRDEAVIAIEALVRWNHPQRGLVEPSEFIPLAEETGLILQLGDWVLQCAVRDGIALARAGFSRLRVAVNLSALQFRQRDISHIVQLALASAGAQAVQLQLEITESVLMQNVEATAEALRALSESGVEVSLDDFGTGYSSLSYLKRFPIDVLKIDRSFVRDILTDADDAAIASAIISMAHSLGIQVVAEGVETREQLEFLRARDCDYVQGYYISEPRPAAELPPWLRARRS
jgi:diguanylate cyclase (GGDEF)-like protein